jgi:hypothetical protein
MSYEGLFPHAAFFYTVGRYAQAGLNFPHEHVSKSTNLRAKEEGIFA